MEQWKVRFRVKGHHVEAFFVIAPNATKAVDEVIRQFGRNYIESIVSVSVVK